MLELAATIYVIGRVIEWAAVFLLIVVPAAFVGSLYAVESVKSWRAARRFAKEPRDVWIAEWEADIQRHEARPQ